MSNRRRSITSLFPWERTWPDRPDSQHDWHVPKATLGGKVDPLGGSPNTLRIMKASGGPQSGRWEWAVQKVVSDGPGKRRLFGAAGFEATAKEAREAAERAWVSAY